MSTGVIALIVAVILLIAGVAVATMYNRFVAQRNLVAESWRQIDVELKRRYDLIPNLIETVTAFATHERQVFESVVQARANAIRVHDSPGSTPQAQASAEQNLSGSLGRLFAVAENYPTLKSDRNFVHLQNQMTDTEDRIAAGRRFYNGNVRALNTRVESFPSNMIANVFGFSQEQYFELDDVGARDAVRADFSALTGRGPAGRDTYRQHDGQSGTGYRRPEPGHPEVTTGFGAPPLGPGRSTAQPSPYEPGERSAQHRPYENPPPPPTRP